jgi:NCS1 family nucleobase:cation symporter-1
MDLARIQSSPLYNPDLAPTTPEQRHWGTYNYAALWISMSVNILTYMLAASLIQGGMDWKQAVFTVFLGNTIVLVPMLLNSHPGARYGVPFPVLARASFGVLGANVAAVLRALVACGWFGIQTWVGGEAVSSLLTILFPGWAHVAYGTAICFFVFWLINLAVILKGIEYIRFLQGISAPVLLAVGLLLLGWAYKTAGGFGPMLAAPSRFASFSDFLKFLIPALNATVGFWAPAPAGHRTGTRPAHDHDALLADRHPGDLGDCRYLWQRDLGPSATTRPLSLADCGGNLARRDFACHAQRQHWR